MSFWFRFELNTTEITKFKSAKLTSIWMFYLFFSKYRYLELIEELNFDLDYFFVYKYCLPFKAIESLFSACPIGVSGLIWRLIFRSDIE